MKGLRGKTVIVTGGAGGIGAAICRRFAEEGAKVAVFDLDLARAEEVVVELKATAEDSLAVAVDIADHEAVMRAVAETEKALGPIAVLVNNAGIDVFRPFLKTDPNLWQKIISVNLTGALNLHHAVLPGMAERKAGRVVNVSSDAARNGSSGEAVYAACKAGLVALSKTLAREHARDGLTFNIVCPGPTETGLLQTVLDTSPNPEKLAEAFRRAVPLGRLGQPEDIAGAVVFLASDEANYITGQVLSVSGGLTMNG